MWSALQCQWYFSPFEGALTYISNGLHVVRLATDFAKWVRCRGSGYEPMCVRLGRVLAQCCSCSGLFLKKRKTGPINCERLNFLLYSLPWSCRWWSEVNYCMYGYRYGGSLCSVSCKARSGPLLSGSLLRVSQTWSIAAVCTSKIWSTKWSTIEYCTQMLCGTKWNNCKIS